MYTELIKEDLTELQNKKMGQFNKGNDTHVSKRKVISFSDPFPSNRIKRIVNNMDLLMTCHRNISKKRELAKSKNNNDDLVKYLQQFDEIDKIHSYSLPMLKANSTPVAMPNYESITCSAQTFPKENHYQTCFRPGDNYTENNTPIYNFSHFTNEYTPYPKNLSPRQSSALQPPKRKFIDSMPSLSESNRKIHNRGASIETSSALSSETDSDFTFYPCYRQFHDSIGLESASFMDSISQLPSQLEDPDSPCPPFRKGFHENSLEDFSRQFYLEDDALSDDVFVDDYSMSRNDDMEICTFNCCQGRPAFRNSFHDADVNSQFRNMSILETPKRSCSDFNRNVNNLILDESHCRTVAFEAREERSHSLTLVFKEAEIEELKTRASVSSKEMISVEVQINDAVPSSVLQEKKRISESEFEDYDLSEYNLNLANAFDSLRRNSMQTKSRKLWKERRTKMRRSTLFNVKTPDAISDECNLNEFVNDNEKHRKHSETLPCTHNICKSSTDLISKKINNAKPLRGILKNKNNVNTTVLDSPSSKNSVIAHQGGVYEYYDNDISADSANRVCTVMNQGNGRQPFIQEPPMVTCCNNNNDSSSTDPSLESRANNHRRNASPRSMSSPPLHRRLNQPSHNNTYSPTYVSVGVQVNLLD